MSRVFLVVTNESYHFGTVQKAFWEESDAEKWIENQSEDNHYYRVERMEVE